MESIGFLKQSSRLLSLFKSARFSSSAYASTAITQSRRTYSKTENQSSAEAQAPPPTELEKKLQAEVETLTTQVQTLEQQKNELLDKYKRALADGENLRTRLTKQIQDAKIFGIQSFCKDLLEVADTLGQATVVVPKDQLSDSNPHLKNLYDGLVLTKNSLGQVFKRHGLEPINPLKEKFNPNFHEALFQKECNDVEPGTVVEVTKIGYKLHERCIRPALVGVSRK